MQKGTFALPPTSIHVPPNRKQRALQTKKNHQCIHLLAGGSKQHPANISCKQLARELLATSGSKQGLNSCGYRQVMVILM